MSHVEALSSQPAGRVLGFEIDEPQVGATEVGYSLTLSGSILTQGGHPPFIQARSRTPLPDGRVFTRSLADLPLNTVRGDVKQRFGDASGDWAGFRHSVSLLGLGRKFEFDIAATGQGGEVAPLVIIRGQRHLLETSFEPRMRPVLICTIGRAGSTWMTQLVGQHPEIVTYRPFQHEPHISAYWAELLRQLAKPASYGQAITTDVPKQRPWQWWLGDQRVSPPPHLTAEPEIIRWLDKQSVEDLAGFCQSRIDGFYHQVARVQGKPRARYFAERTGSLRATTILSELYKGYREVFLVRDFRDVLCSRLAFIRKTGVAQFNRNLTDTDEDYVRTVMARELKHFHGLWARHQQHSHVVKYEDLMREPEATLVQLFNYLQAADDAETVSDLLRRARGTSADRQERHKTTPNETASIGRWRRELDGPLLEACQEAFHEPLSAFGYQM